MFSIFSKDPKDLFKICEWCNNAIVCEANLNVIKDKNTKLFDWYVSIGSEAADKLSTVLQSLERSEKIRFNSDDTAVALDLLKSLADQLDWCTGNCTTAGSKLKFDVINDDCLNVSRNSVGFEKCTQCERTMVSEKNLWALRKGIQFGFVASLGGALILPLIGFGSTFYPALTDRLLEIVRSLGATGVGTLLYGSTASALGLLSSLANQLDWCSGRCTTQNESNFVKFRITITKISSFISHRSPDFQLGTAIWNINVSKQLNHLAIGINSNGWCKIRGMVELIAMNEKTKSIRQLFMKNVTPTDGVSINEFISWSGLIAQDAFFHRNSITIDVILRLRNEETRQAPLTQQLVCLICLQDIET